ncbi:MAG: hypothetical protein KAR35_08270, partial [Candidatus Heimdallarchaeota archaeon]|nr:hypothetical protein [Candidatus Heimdallarchaeota archaeon]MCK5049354.1 hypothetical protein [Candidatus Heimdallarchaeota archaeon]
MSKKRLFLVIIGIILLSCMQVQLLAKTNEYFKVPTNLKTIQEEHLSKTVLSTKDVQSRYSSKLLSNYSTGGITLQDTELHDSLFGKWSTYFGGNVDDEGLCVISDSMDNIIILGKTNSPDFPTLNAYDVDYNGDDDVFVTKFTSTGTLLWSTYLGGND